MINSTNPFNDPEIKKQLLQEEGIVETPDIEEVESGVSDELQEMISSAPMLPKSAKNIILDSSAINKNLKEAKSQEFNAALNTIISKYNEEYGTDLSIDFSNISKTLVSVSDPSTRRTLELYVSEVFKSIKPVLLLHLLNRLVLCLDFVLDPKRMLDTNNLSPADFFVIVDKLQGYILTLSDIIDQSTIKDSDSLLQRLADEKNDPSLNSPEAKESVENFMKLFKRDAGIEE